MKIPSEVWNYFDKIAGSKYVKCTLCNKILERIDSKTDSMKRHLQKTHELLFKQAQPKKVSKVWIYFDKIVDSKNVKCAICNRILQRVDSRTDSMKRHLQEKHGLVLEEAQPERVIKLQM
jgi:phage FluMu protein Com